MSIMPSPSIGGPTRRGPDDRPNSVYRYYDHAGRLIYVGITARGMTRQQQHNASSDFWPYVATQHVEHCGSRDEALNVERELIRLYRPPFNKVHNEDWEPLRKAYLGIVEAERAYEAVRGGGAPEVHHSLCDPREDEDPCPWGTDAAQDGPCGYADICWDAACDMCHAKWHGFEEALPFGYEAGRKSLKDRLKHGCGGEHRRCLDEPECEVGYYWLAPMACQIRGCEDCHTSAHAHGEGHDAGYKRGREVGHADGYDEGRQDGRDELLGLRVVPGAAEAEG